MRNILTICKRELTSYFDSLIAYVLLILFLSFSGFFTWLFGSDIFLINQATLSVFFGIAYWSLFFFIPALTMRSIAEEKKNGTLELLLTKSLTVRQLILGKYLSTLTLILIALGLTIVYYISVSKIGDVDHATVIAGYLGLILMSSMYIGIGIFASSFTNNQVVAFLFTLIFGILFHVVFGVLSGSFSGILGSVFGYFDTNYHFQSISRGVIDSRDLIFFLSITALSLYLAEINLYKKQIIMIKKVLGIFPLFS